MARSIRTSPPVAPVLPASAAGNGTRSRILAAGLELFAERGYHATSIRDMAAAADMQSASLYSHFPSKEAILAELVLLGHEEHHQRILSAMLESGPDPRDQLVAIVRAHVLTHAEFPMLGVVANYERHNLSPAAAAPVLAIRRRSEALLSEILQRGVRDGAFDLVHEDATSRAIGSMGVSVATWWPERPDGMQAAELAEAYGALALRMVGARPT